MRLQINGKNEDVPRELTIQELLSHRNVESPNMVSVELNGTILQRAEFATQRINEGDVIEFLYFMGGG